MKLLIEKRNYIILFIIIILIIWIFSFKKINPYIKSFSLNDKVLTVIIYEKVDRKKISKNIKLICDKYNNKKMEYKKNNELSEFNKDVNFSSSYAVLDIINYFKKIDISKYSINNDGNISVGKRYRNKKYVGGIVKKSDNSLVKTVMLEDESMITIGGDDTVSVICKDNVDAFALANYLYNTEYEKVSEKSLKYNCKVYYYKENNRYEKK